MFAVRTPTEDDRKVALARDAIGPIEIDQHPDAIAHGNGDVALDQQIVFAAYLVGGPRMPLSGKPARRLRRAPQIRMDSRAHYAFKAEFFARSHGHYTFPFHIE